MDGTKNYTDRDLHCMQNSPSKKSMQTGSRLPYHLQYIRDGKVNVKPEEGKMNLRELYKTNADFRRYVDHYCQNYVEGRKITVKEALTHEIVRLYAEDLERGEES